MSRERDIAYGRHSQIPECCIAYFIDQWQSELWKDSAYRNVVHESDYNYVPCPACFYAKRKVKIIDCIVDCRRECWRYYD
jgi:hypothetical protein